MGYTPDYIVYHELVMTSKVRHPFVLHSVLMFVLSRTVLLLLFAGIYAVRHRRRRSLAG